jgi:spore germination cell wall hydrolase CwlJ-like protein
MLRKPIAQIRIRMFRLVRACRFAAAFLMFAQVGQTAHAAQASPQPEIAMSETTAPEQSGGIVLVVPQVATPSPPSLVDLVSSSSPGTSDEESACLAKAVYFEARGESLEGQLAVAQVILNRAKSGIYPDSICKVVTQKSQFSFIRRGRFPAVDESSDCWRKANAIAYIARNDLAQSIASDVLWYHANYVSPPWRRSLKAVARIGAHIFYS